jgi:hypothetical protein
MAAELNQTFDDITTLLCTKDTILSYFKDEYQESSPWYDIVRAQDAEFFEMINFIIGSLRENWASISAAKFAAYRIRRDVYRKLVATALHEAHLLYLSKKGFGGKRPPASDDDLMSCINRLIDMDWKECKLVESLKAVTRLDDFKISRELKAVIIARLAKAVTVTVEAGGSSSFASAYSDELFRLEDAAINAALNDRFDNDAPPSKRHLLSPEDRKAVLIGIVVALIAIAKTLRTRGKSHMYIPTRNMTAAIRLITAQGTATRNGHDRKAIYDLLVHNHRKAHPQPDGTWNYSLQHYVFDMETVDLFEKLLGKRAEQIKERIDHAYNVIYVDATINVVKVDDLPDGLELAPRVQPDEAALEAYIVSTLGL